MFDLDELQLAARNHGMPLELLREPITPAGLHYLLIHFDIPHVDAEAWRLEVGGLVAQPLSLSLADLRARPARTIPVTLECAGNGRALIPDHTPSQPWVREAVGTAEWTGTPLAPILEEAGVEDSANNLVFTGLDRGIQGEIEHDYARSLRVDEALGEDVLLAYEMNGAPLLPQHGFPVRLLVPGWYGMAHVKWLGAITAIEGEFDGYQQAHTYRIMRNADDMDGPFVERMLPRSLLVPPGIPDFLTRERHVNADRVELEGRAWSGQAPIERVEVSDDGGETWADAELGPPLGPYAWRGFYFEWIATPGMHELCARATDAAGNTQPLNPEWNYGGFCNNAVQRVRVTVAAPDEIPHLIRPLFDELSQRGYSIVETKDDEHFGHVNVLLERGTTQIEFSWGPDWLTMPHVRVPRAEAEGHWSGSGRTHDWFAPGVWRAFLEPSTEPVDDATFADEARWLLECLGQIEALTALTRDQRAVLRELTERHIAVLVEGRRREIEGRSRKRLLGRLNPWR